MTLLVVTDLPFWHGATGSQQRILSLCRFLSSQGELHVYYLNYFSGAERTRAQQQLPLAHWHHAPLPLLLLRKTRRFLGERLGIGASGRPQIWRDSFWEDNWALTRLARRIRPTAAIFEYAYLNPLTRAMRNGSPDTPCAVDTIDALSIRAERLPGMEFMTVETEKELLEPFDLLIAIQPGEAGYFENLLPHKRVIVAGHPAQVQELPTIAHTGVNLLFLGSNTTHNQTAIAGFLKEVWPEVLANVAGPVCLRIGGSVCDYLKTMAPALCVELRGHVEELSTLYAETDIVINPVYAGSGLKIKNVEALCHGKCLVTTPLGAEGLHSGTDAPPMAVCDSPETMRNIMLELIANEPRRALYAEAAKRHVSRFLDTKQVYTALREWLAELEKHGRF